MDDALARQIEDMAREAHEASTQMATLSLDVRNRALEAMGEALRQNTPLILAANKQDMDAARAAGTDEALLDRLMLDRGRIEDMADALQDLVDLPDPLGVVQKDYELYNGIALKRVSVPLGVVAMIYEARPNVTSDAIGICIKSGNACVLRGGSLALHSNVALTDVLKKAAYESGIPYGAIHCIASTDRAATDIVMGLHGIIDVIIPRGGAALIQHCVQTSTVPVIETGTGNCHVYVHRSADQAMAKDILINSKCRRFGVCNAAETLLVDRAIADEFLPDAMRALHEHGVLMHCDETALALAKELFSACANGTAYVPATEADWATEYLGPEIALACVADVDEAIDHINRYGTHHSEAIVATDEDAIEQFLSRVDAAAVYANAATAFTDGGQFGLGAEIGISTQKLHVRGPFALDALTSYKYLLRGSGQVRD